MTMGFKGGLVMGLLQDTLSVLQGKRIGYVEYIKRSLGYTNT
jgi:hypothetical protein